MAGKDASTASICETRLRSPRDGFGVWSIALAAAAMFAMGCGDANDYVPVSGQVTIDGKPLTMGIVRFYPAGGRQSGGSLDAEGGFSLSTYESDDGTAVGDYRVAVIAKEPLSGNRFRWHTPKEYANPATSGLTQVIEGPSDDLSIELTWGAKKGPFIEQL